VKNYPNVPFEFRNFWWENDHTLVIHVLSVDEATAAGEEGILWLDTNTGKILDILPESETPDHVIVSAHLFDQSMVGFFSDRSFFTYDSKDELTRRQFSVFFSYSEWMPAPVNFPGEQNCRVP